MTLFSPGKMGLMINRHVSVGRRLSRVTALIAGLLVATLVQVGAGEEPLLRFVQWNDMHVEDPPPAYALANEKMQYLVDSVNAEVTLESKDYTRIEQEVKEAIEALGGNGGLILSAFIFPEVPLEGIKHFIEAWKKHR